MFSNYEPNYGANPPPPSPPEKNAADPDGKSKGANILVWACGGLLLLALAALGVAVSRPSTPAEKEIGQDERVMAAMALLDHVAATDFNPEGASLENVGSFQASVLQLAEKMELASRNEADDPDSQYFRKAEEYLWNEFNTGRRLRQISKESPTITIWMDTGDPRHLAKLSLRPEALESLAIAHELAALMALTSGTLPNPDSLSARISQLEQNYPAIAQEILHQRISQLYGAGNTHLAESLEGLMSRDRLNAPPPEGAVELIQRPNQSDE